MESTEGKSQIIALVSISQSPRQCCQRNSRKYEIAFQPNAGELPYGITEKSLREKYIKTRAVCSKER